MMETTLLTFPLGPKLRTYLGITSMEQQGQQKSAAEWRAFEDYLSAQVAQRGLASDDVDELADLLEELVLTKLPYAALALAEAGAVDVIRADFRCCLAVGSAAFMAGEFTIAEEYFRVAQSIVPEEIAPYTNMCDLLYRTERDDECLNWALAALKVDANVFRLWEAIGAVYFQRFGERAGEELQSLARSYDSWAGRLIATKYQFPDDAMLLAEVLDDYYSQGLRSEEFLLEYTAALGVSLQYERIPQIVWETEHRLKGNVCWQLYAHAAQAYLAMNDFDLAKSSVEKALKRAAENEAAQRELSQLLDEIERAAAEGEPAKH